MELDSRGASLTLIDLSAPANEGRKFSFRCDRRWRRLYTFRTATRANVVLQPTTDPFQKVAVCSGTRSPSGSDEFCTSANDLKAQLCAEETQWSIWKSTSTTARLRRTCVRCSTRADSSEFSEASSKSLRYIKVYFFSDWTILSNPSQAITSHSAKFAYRLDA